MTPGKKTRRRRKPSVTASMTLDEDTDETGDGSGALIVSSNVAAAGGSGKKVDFGESHVGDVRSYY